MGEIVLEAIIESERDGVCRKRTCPPQCRHGSGEGQHRPARAGEHLHLSGEGVEADAEPVAGMGVVHPVVGQHAEAPLLAPRQLAGAHDRAAREGVEVRPHETSASQGSSLPRPARRVAKRASERSLVYSRGSWKGSCRGRASAWRQVKA